MSIVINTNMQALSIQGNLNSATDGMNTSMKRMSTGFKINSAADDAAGSAISSEMETTLSSSKVATQNAQIGANLLTTTEGTLNTIKSNLQRIRDLAEQAANGTYTDKSAMLAEVQQRSDEIDRVSTNTDFNGTKLLDGSGNAASSGIELQIGTGTSADNTITLDKSIFAAANTSALGFTKTDTTTAFGKTATSKQSRDFLTKVDAALKNISDRKTQIGAFQNRLTSAQANLSVQQTNLAASNSTIKDADIATESANYVRAQILQQASVSLLSQANSQPQIALKLIGG